MIAIDKEKQFVLDTINKELDLVNSGIHFNSFEEMSEWTKSTSNWFQDYFFTEEQFAAWKDYVINHPYIKSKHFTKKGKEEYFAMYDLFCGFSVGV